jgi:hypothetical protein
MPGPLQTNPYLKSYDELRRTLLRMETFLDANSFILDDEQQERIRIMCEGIQKAINAIPEEFHVTKWHQQRKKGN